MIGNREEAIVIYGVDEDVHSRLSVYYILSAIHHYGDSYELNYSISAASMFTLLRNDARNRRSGTGMVVLQPV